MPYMEHDPSQSMDAWAAARDRAENANMATEIATLRAEIERLRSGIQRFLDGDYPNPRDHRPETCSHGNYWYSGCAICDTEFLASLIGAKTQLSGG